MTAFAAACWVSAGIYVWALAAAARRRHEKRDAWAVYEAAQPRGDVDEPHAVDFHLWTREMSR